MDRQPITVKLPDELYERIRQIAEESDRSLEAVVVESLDLLFSETAGVALQALANYSDDRLWALVHRHMSRAESTRLVDLSRQSRTSALTARQQEELDHLLERVDRDLLLRSEALRLLKARGHSVERYLTPAP